MSTTFATGKIAWGLCDRCGRRYYLSELKNQIIDQKKTELLVCSECIDEDHPQYRLGKTPIFDPQALRNPRPDKRTDVSNNPLLTDVYTGAFGVPTFTTKVTPEVDVLISTGLPVTRS